MSWLLLAPFGLTASLMLAACTPSETDMTTNASASTPAADSPAGSMYRQNPQPKQAYPVTMTIENAPGPFASMTALAQYDVVNRECLRPPKDNLGGHTTPVPTEDVEIPLTKVSDTEYVGTVYADQMLDEDYNGRGVCHWKLIQFRVHMKASGADGETLFIPSIPDEKLLAGEPQKLFFWKEEYPRSEVANYPYFGDTERSKLAPQIVDDDLFTVTIKPSMEATP